MWDVVREGFHEFGRLSTCSQRGELQPREAVKGEKGRKRLPTLSDADKEEKWRRQIVHVAADS